jgi:hypothetical protein
VQNDNKAAGDLTMKTHYFLIFACNLLLSSTALGQSVLETPQPTKEDFLPSHQAQQQAPELATIQAERQPSVEQAYQSTAWFHTLDLTLRHDLNNNGFYSQLRVRFDANSKFNSQPVYAVYSLINNAGQERVIHTSSIFTLYRESSNDWFSIDTDLQQFPRDYYKLRIQLKDAQTGYLLAEMSGYDNSTMDRLALEDQQRDSYVAVIVREESGGSLGILALLGLSLIGFYRRSQFGANHNRPQN